MVATKGKVEPNFGLDNFGRAKYANETEAIANAVLNLLTISMLVLSTCKRLCTITNRFFLSYYRQK